MTSSEQTFWTIVHFFSRQGAETGQADIFSGRQKIEPLGDLLAEKNKSNG